MKNKNNIKRLVKNACACYLGDKHDIGHYCCSVDGSCVYFNQEQFQLPQCAYFEQAVLPLDERLEFDYKLERNMEVEIKAPKPRVKCKKCGDSFFANSNRQSYCENCKETNAKEKAKERMRKMRQNRD